MAKTKPQKLFKGSDLVMTLNMTDKLGNQVNLLDADSVAEVSIKIFTKTTPPKYAVELHQSDIEEGNVVRVDDSKIAFLSPGVLYLEYDIKFYSDEMEDGFLNLTKIEQTNIILQ